MPSSDRIDWARATVKVTVPVQHTAMETVQEIDVPLAAFLSYCQGNQSTESESSAHAAHLSERAVPSDQSREGISP